LRGVRWLEYRLGFSGGGTRARVAFVVNPSRQHLCRLARPEQFHIREFYFRSRLRSAAEKIAADLSDRFAVERAVSDFASMFIPQIPDNLVAGVLPQPNARHGQTCTKSSSRNFHILSFYWIHGSTTGS